VCDLETSRMSAPYIYDISRLRVKEKRDSEGVKNILQTANFTSCG
jgi:hypothetical protein